MPAKIERCVKKVRKKSPKMNAWAVCAESTGMKRKKGGGWTKGKKK